MRQLRIVFATARRYNHSGPAWTYASNHVVNRRHVAIWSEINILGRCVLVGCFPGRCLQLGGVVYLPEKPWEDNVKMLHCSQFAILLRQDCG